MELQYNSEFYHSWSLNGVDALAAPIRVHKRAPSSSLIVALRLSDDSAIELNVGQRPFKYVMRALYDHHYT